MARLVRDLPLAEAPFELVPRRLRLVGAERRAVHARRARHVGRAVADGGAQPDERGLVALGLRLLDRAAHAVEVGVTVLDVDHL